MRTARVLPVMMAMLFVVGSVMVLVGKGRLEGMTLLGGQRAGRRSFEF